MNMSILSITARIIHYGITILDIVQYLVNRDDKSLNMDARLVCMVPWLLSLLLLLRIAIILLPINPDSTGNNKQS